MAERHPMDRNIVFVKTKTGSEEIVCRRAKLDYRQRLVLLLTDGITSVGDIEDTSKIGSSIESYINVLVDLHLIRLAQLERKPLSEYSEVKQNMAVQVIMLLGERSNRFLALIGEANDEKSEMEALAGKIYKAVKLTISESIADALKPRLQKSIEHSCAINSMLEKA